MPRSELISIEPATGAFSWRGKVADPTDIDMAVARARKAFLAWARTPLERRIAIVERYAQIVSAHKDALAELIARETGKPLWDCQGEVASVIGKVAISLQAYQARTPAHVQEFQGMVQRLEHRPHGVLAVLGPYNFPAHLPNGHIIPALIAGNCVAFKPSEQTPAVGEALRGYFLEAGLPDHVLQIVHGGHDGGKLLAAHPDIDGLLFTGSAMAGAALAQQFGHMPHKILALEMGGNNPLVAWVKTESDIEAAATIIFQSAYLSSGQRCTCARRLIVPERFAEAIMAAVKTLIERMIIAEPFAKPAPFMGPLINTMAADRLQRVFAHMEAQGGRSITRLARQDDQLPFVSAGLIDVTEMAQRADEEYFGPLLQIIRVRDFGAALAESNATRFGLSAAIITSKSEVYEDFRLQVRAGVINWNRATNGAASNAPFGGVGSSGNHRPSAYYAADYCAWPVASLEQSVIALQPLQGLRSA